MAAKFKATDFKKITFPDMADFIEENYPDDKEWFKGVCYQNKKGEAVEKYNHLNAKLRFCEKYAPNLIPKAKKKELVTQRLADW